MEETNETSSVEVQPTGIEPSGKVEVLAQVKDENVSDLPYHNAETEKIVVEREKILNEEHELEAEKAEAE